MHTTDPRTRIFLTTGALYLVTLLLVVAPGAVMFRDLYSKPQRLIHVGDEDTLIKAYDIHYRAAYDSYRRFIRPAGAGLAIYLAIWTATFGVWRKKHWQGIVALAAGSAATVLAFSLLPSMYFPLDQYPVSALWVMGNVFPLGIAWILATLFGRALTYRTSP
jgi:hypothetical protein